MKWKQVSSLVVAMAAVCVLVAGCGGGDDDGSGTSASSEPLKIGASLPLTGEFSEPGKAAQHGYEVWETQVNEQGGLLGRDVEIIIRDDATDQNTVVSDYNNLISSENVDLLLGTVSSLLNLPASSVAERSKMLFVEPSGGAPEMFEQGYEYLFFSQPAVPANQGVPWAEWLVALPASERPKTVAYAMLNDPFTVPLVEGVKEILDAAGIESVYEETYPEGTRNFDAIASAIKSSDPDLVVQGSAFNDGVGLVRSMLKAGFTPDMLFQANAPTLGPEYEDAVGKGNTEGVMYPVSYSTEVATAGNKEFLAKYEEMFNAEPAEDAADAYAAAQVLQAAVEAVGTVDEQDKLADWLHENTVETILGPLTWDENGEPQGESMTGQWQSGKPGIILPENLATVDTIIPGWQPQG